MAHKEIGETKRILVVGAVGLGVKEADRGE